MGDEFGVRHRNLLNADFFACDGRHVPLVDTVIGNPPFIRYQRFTGDTRRRALAKAALQGVKLSELSSSWVPFLVHAAGFLKPGGRMAMVAPFEMTHAGYAQPLLEFLSALFGGWYCSRSARSCFPISAKIRCWCLRRIAAPAGEGFFCAILRIP